MCSALMDVAGVETAFFRMLANADIDLVKPSVLEVWKIFKAFSSVAVDCADDAFLFQSGVHDFTGSELFYLDFVRQFGLRDDNGEHDHLEQLHCEFLYEPHKTLRSLDTNLWSYQCDSVDDFFRQVERLLEYRTPVAHYVPVRLNVFQERV